MLARERLNRSMQNKTTCVVSLTVVIHVTKILFEFFQLEAENGAA